MSRREQPVTDRINLVLIASGSGTDAEAIMKAWKSGYLPEVNPPTLISTKRDAGCIEKAETLGLRFLIIDRRDHSDLDGFNRTLRDTLLSDFTDLVFLVGCIVKIFPIPGMDMYNSKANRARIRKSDSILNSLAEIFLKFRAIISP